jgi:antitoxin CcdA
MQISEVRAQRWLDENKEAIDSSNAYVEKNGLPLAQYRQF